MKRQARETGSRYVVAALVLWAAAARGGEPEPGGPATRDAVALCHEADQVPVAERSAVLARGLARAEEAVKANPRDAVAHFAVFCNLGKRLEMERHGGELFATFGDLRRVQREIDVTLTLAPDYPAALAAKGEMLVELPRLLGGDRREGERLLRRAAALDPDDPRVRLMLANVAQAGSHEALGHAAIAPPIRPERRIWSERVDARSVLASLP
jgi:hypothetical protein